MDSSSKDGAARQKKHKSTSFVSLVNWKWAATAFLSSISISIVLSLLSSELLNYLNVFFSVLILLFFIMLGVVFDIIGLAVATADIKPFNSMAAQKVRGGKQAVMLIKNAEQVSNFCNDIIGDIASIVSGATASAIAVKLAALTSSAHEIWINLVICGLVSGFTVGLKSVGKAVGMNYSKTIVSTAAFILSIFDKKSKHTPKKRNSSKSNSK